MAPFAQAPFASLLETPRRPHAYLALQSRDVTIRVDGETVRVRYRELGSGRPLVLVHGLMTSGYSFRYVIGPLSALGFRVIVPDLPGAGESQPFRQPHSAPRLARALGAFLDALDLRGAAMIGNSMGGYVAMLLALDDPGAMSALVDVHSPALPLRRLRLLHLAMRSKLVRSVLCAVVARDPERFAHRNVHYRDETLKSLEEARVYGAPLSTSGGRAAFASWLGDGLDPRDLRDFCTRLARRLDRGESFPVPLRLVYSREDPMVPPAVGDALHRLVPDASMVWLEHSSHFAHVDTPERFLEAVADFL